MAEWGYLLKHLEGARWMTASQFREAVIKAEREAEGDRIPLLVDVVLAAMEYAEFGDELDEAFIAAGYLPSGEDEDDLA